MKSLLLASATALNLSTAAFAQDLPQASNDWF
ncbi:MAG: hypothetical protein ACJASV_000722 [Pseudorhodobacter sp.]|jgi:hypothetical protein